MSCCTVRSTVRSTATAIAVSFIVGCAPPTNLSFDSTEPLNLGGGTQPAGGQGVLRDVTAGTESATQAVGDDASPQVGAGDAQGSDTDVVRSTFNTLLDGWVRCFHRPGRCDVAAITAPDSPERQRLAESLNYYAIEQLRTKPNEGQLQWGIESLSFTSGDRARLTTCEHDTRIYFDSSVADTELGDIILDATIWTRQVEWTLAKVNDSWQLWSRRIERRSPANRFCTP